MPYEDFDFVLGSWQVANRRRQDPLDPTCVDWDEFDSVGEHRALPGGAGNIEAYETAAMPGVGRFHGLALRLYDPASDLWRIWWSSSTAPGVLDPPVVGRFDGGVGTFVAHDTVAGVELEVRFTWEDLGPGAARWQQAFSLDGGASWDTNWVMDMTRPA